MTDCANAMLGADLVAINPISDQNAGCELGQVELEVIGAARSQSLFEWL